MMIAVTVEFVQSRFFWDEEAVLFFREGLLREHMLRYYVSILMRIVCLHHDHCPCNGSSRAMEGNHQQKTDV